jgi:hypothetical protein
MNQRIKELANQMFSMEQFEYAEEFLNDEFMEQFAKLVVEDMHKKVIASILITDVVMEEKGLTPTSEDYIRAINKDFGVEE